jgi:hypothetical protein
VRVVAGVLLGGERVQLAADRIHRLRDVDSGARRGRLEQQVFQEVRGAGHGGTLVTRSDTYPHPYRGRANPGQVFGDNPQTAGK